MSATDRDAPFGVYVLCHRGDFRLVRGCLESIRVHAGDVPICLLVDGDIATAAVERQYGCQVIQKKDVRTPELRERSFGGWGYAKMIPLWEGPFERFLYMDADTVMIGDVCALARRSTADMIVARVDDFPYTRENVTTHWLDAEFMDREHPDFPLLSFPFFVAGVFFGRRGIFDLQEYLRCLDVQRREPERSFRAGDQGMLNYLTFSGAQAGRLTVEVADFQWWPLFLPQSQIDALNATLAPGVAVPAGLSTVLHYICVKPSLYQERSRWRAASAPAGWPLAMNHFRLRSLLRAGVPRPLAWARLLAEDAVFHGGVMQARLRRFFSPRASPQSGAASDAKSRPASPAALSSGGA